jgi:hypothetical protein
MWVHRLSVDESGSPQASVKLSELEDQLMDVAKAVMLGPRQHLQDEPVEARAFLLSELFDHGILRQGWGAPGMRATHKAQFLKHHVIAMWRYWDAIPISVRDDLKKEGADYSRLFSVLQPYYREAAGRYTIIARMVEMRYDDIVFLPNVPEPGTTFTVARINDRMYTFEEPARRDGTAVWHFDFGHRRDVRDVRTFKYGPKALERGVFGAPFLHAIDPVTGARLEELQTFVSRQYEPA